jgi:hypothetical protein
MKAFPGLNLLKPVTILITATLCISCHKPVKKQPGQEKNTGPATIARTPSPETGEPTLRGSLQEQAEDFFSKFSIALAKADSTMASAMIADEKRERFRTGFRFWKGVQFVEPMVVKVSGDKTLIEVEVSIKTAQGNEDRETKKLKLSNGKWLLLDS